LLQGGKAAWCSYRETQETHQMRGDRLVQHCREVAAF